MLTYADHAGLRQLLTETLGEGKFRKAADVGCGYGRMSLALHEFAEETWGFEREPHLVSIGQSLIPQVHIRNVTSLTNLDVEDSSFEFAMTFTVLQHMVDANVKKAIAEMKRIVGHGYIMLAEKTEPVNIGDPAGDGCSFVSIGRPISVWEEWMYPWQLVRTQTRPAVLESEAYQRLGQYIRNAGDLPPEN